MDACKLRFGSATLAVFVACGFDTGGVGSGTASVGSVGEGTEDGNDSTPSASATMSASGATEASGTTDPTSPTDPSDSVDSTVTAVDTGDATTSTVTVTATDATATDSGGAAVHHLQTTDQGNCTQPLWCFSGDVWNEYGEPIYGEQCFTSPVAPPFELISMHYVVADVAPELVNFMIEVHSRDENGPTDQISFEQRPAVDATPGSHEHVFDTPIQIVDTEFCVGFSAPYAGLAGALGMAVDVGTAVSDASFIRLEGPTGCAIPVWSDVIDDRDPTPSGNWCIDVQIREIP